ncbi:glycosyltransferase [Desulfocurvus sp. DL9XJH121]
MTGTETPRVFTHTLLRGQGGTTRVARAVHAGLGAGVFSYERDDGLGEDADAATAPADVGRAARDAGAGLAHVHASEDWAACMNGVADSGLKSVVTLHDCRAFTGGCPYPLDCKFFAGGCTADCPRLYADADQVAGARREAMLRAAPEIAAPSRWMAGLARAVWPDLSVRVVPNGVPWPVRLPPRAETRRKVGVAPGARMVLFVAHGGADAAYKQGRKFLQAFERIKARVPEALCYVVGGGAMERKGSVVHLPYVDAAALARLMRAADVLALPSLADNHPLVVLEAMSAGLPVAAFASGGIPEQIRNGQDGLLVPPGDWSGLAQAVTGLLQDLVTARHLGDAARADGERRFSQDRMVGDYLKLYARLP